MKSDFLLVICGILTVLGTITLIISINYHDKIKNIEVVVEQCRTDISHQDDVNDRIIKIQNDVIHNMNLMIKNIDTICNYLDKTQDKMIVTPTEVQ